MPDIIRSPSTYILTLFCSKPFVRSIFLRQYYRGKRKEKCYFSNSIQLYQFFFLKKKKINNWNIRPILRKTDPIIDLIKIKKGLIRVKHK